MKTLTYKEAVDFVAVSYEKENIIDIVGDKTGRSYEYKGCGVLCPGGRSAVFAARSKSGISAKWRMTKSMRKEALCYGFENEKGNVLIVIKTASKGVRREPKSENSRGHRGQRASGSGIKNKLHESEQSKTNQMTEAKQESAKSIK